MRSLFKKILLFVLALLFLGIFSFAQEDDFCDLNLDGELTCETKEECQLLLDKLEKCELKMNEKMKELEKKEKKAKKEKGAIQTEIYLLKDKIKKIQLKINQHQALLGKLISEIRETEDSIGKIDLEIKNSKENLKRILREIYKEDQKSTLEILLSGETLSDYFTHLSNLRLLNLENQRIIKKIRNAQSLLEKQEKILEQDRRAVEEIIKIQILRKREEEETKKEKDYLLQLTLKEYKKLKKEKMEIKEEAEKVKEKAKEIRARLFKLVGVRKVPKYEEALEVAKRVEEITGIRAAFLLGILTQESRLGRNVGQCYLRDFKTGKGVKIINGKEIPWPRVMKPSWIPLFLEITNRLNLDPKKTPISCWIPACANKYRVYWQKKYVTVTSKGDIVCHCKGCVPYGWGGAMGPAQLMPFNWVGSDKYKHKIETITKKPADPWDFFDASLGAALHLKDCFRWGAKNEKEAAACYFGGPRNMRSYYHLRIYAEPVMAIAECHQEFITKNTMSSWCERVIF